MSLAKFATLALLYYVFIMQNDAKPLESSDHSQGIHAGFANVATGYRRGSAKLSAIGGEASDSSDNARMQLLYVNTDYDWDEDVKVKHGVGLFKGSWELGNGLHTADMNALSSGFEVGMGGMGRASLVEATMTLGPVEFGSSIGVDTGAIYSNGNVEAKFLGIGGKVGKDGIQACFIFCIGFKW